MNIKPNSDWILINKAVNDHVRNENNDVLLYKPDVIVETTNWAEIIDIGPRCKYITEDMCCSGTFIMCPELSNDMKELGVDRETGNRFFFIRERYLMEDKANRAFIMKA